MFLTIILLGIITLSVSECGRENKTLVELGNEKITLGEFEKQYLKSVGSLDSAKKSSLDNKKDFLNLYINFRLKVKDARERGLLGLSDVQKEVEEYKKSFSPTYLLDKEIITPAIKELYDKRKEEVRASHILLSLPEKPTAEDSVRAYQTADTIIQKLKDGADFATLAEQYSQDRTVKVNRGDLYYFMAGMTVPEFEEAVFSLKVGEFTKKPVRTQFGLHIVKLTDRKPRIESVKLSHILIQDKRDSLGNIIDSLETYNRILEVYNKAKNGENFEALVEQYSEDHGSKISKGDIGYITRRRLAQPLDSAAFIIKTGEVAGPIRTAYGWHVIKKFDEKPLEPFEKVKEQMRDEYKRTPSYKEDYNKFIEKLKNKYDFKISDGGLAFLKGAFDSLKTLGDYTLDIMFSSAQREIVIAEFKGGKVTVNDMMNHLNINRDFTRMALNESTLRSIINSTSENALLNKEADEMKVEKDDEYIASLTDYENGLLVFRIDQDEIWSKVKVSEDEMKSYYENNKSLYANADTTGNKTYKTFEEVKPQISNELQQLKYKEIEKNYLESLRQKYPVVIHEEVLAEAFKE
ncbi:MAG: peptidyl-prolyl cis-trans isomerase [Ignavibacteria bacterium]|nr:peptidyl-prolyl cis-trans isomerase [Ignavibacteria bacterium]